MKKYSRAKALKYINSYLEERPAFYIFIRPSELLLFDKYKPFKTPILDFGCGDGFFTKQLLESSEKIDVGVDIGLDDLKIAEKRKIYKKVVGLDSWKLPFGDNYFSTVISNCVFEHVGNLSKSLKEISRVTRKDGLMFCTVMTSTWNKHLLGGKVIGGSYLKWMKIIQKHPNLFSLEKWDKTFIDSGFEIIDKIGYSEMSASRKNELFHFLSLDSLLTRKLFDKWVVAPWRFRLLNLHKVALNNIRFIPPKTSSAVFYILKKTNKNNQTTTFLS